MKFTSSEKREAMQFILANGADIESIEIKIKSTRSNQQSKARWQWLTMLSNHLNERGMGIVKVLQILKKTPEVDKPTTPEEMYDVFWLPIHKAVSGKEAKTKLGTKEFSEAIEVATRYAAQNFDFGESFPDKFNRG